MRDRGRAPVHPRWRGRGFAATLTGLIVLVLIPASAVAFPPKLAANGQFDFTYGAAVDDSAGGPATGQKPESKLFYTREGSPSAIRWWGVLGTSGPSPPAGVYLWELVNHVWTPRVQLPGADPWAKADTVFDGTTLYVSTRDQKAAVTGNPRESDLFELPYLGNGGWGSVAGPFPITNAGPEALTIAKDSQGRIWAAYESGGSIKAGYTAPGGTSFTFITISHSNVNSDDIASVTAFGGNKIGVYWSDQVAKKDFFAWRLDSDPITTNWTIETAYGGGVGGCPTANSDLCADDHMNIKVYGSEIFVAVKTSLNDVSGAPSDPLIVLLRRSANGTWSSFPVSPISQDATRPITVINPDDNKIWVWATRGSEIDVWESSFSSPGFTSTAFVPWIKGAGSVNNSTSTKQVTDPETGTVVEASVEGSHQAWHNEFLPTAAPPPTTPTITGFNPTSGQVGSTVTIDGTAFTGASDVRFGSTSVGPGNFTVDSDAQITAIVPAGASSGPISVTAPGGTATSVDGFTVTDPPPPSITGFNPTSGQVGSTVTIDGTAFTGASDVRFGSTSVGPGNFTVDSDAQIRATVPAGASSGPISVTTSHGTGTSSSSFAVTVTFVVSDDAEIRKSLPTTNFGSGPSFSVDNRPVEHGLLKFNVDVGTRSIASVKLRVYCVNASPLGGTFFSTETTWQEGTVTWNLAPPAGAGYGSLGTVSRGAWYEVNLTSLVTANGPYSLRITTTSTNGADYATKEGTGAFGPRLVVTLGS